MLNSRSLSKHCPFCALNEAKVLWEKQFAVM